MKKLIKTLLLIFITNTCMAQGGWQWAVSHGDAGEESIHSITTDQWGNIYVAGVVEDLYVRDSAGNIQYDSNFLPILYNYGQEDMWVGKYNFQGKNLWHNYAGGGSSDGVGFMEVDKEGNIYVTGSLYYNLQRPAHTFSNTAISFDSLGTYAAKLDSGGNLLWHKPYGFDSLTNYYISLGGAFISR